MVFKLLGLIAPHQKLTFDDGSSEWPTDALMLDLFKRHYPLNAPFNSTRYQHDPTERTPPGKKPRRFYFYRDVPSCQIAQNCTATDCKHLDETHMIVVERA